MGALEVYVLVRGRGRDMGESSLAGVSTGVYRHSTEASVAS